MQLGEGFAAAGDDEHHRPVAVAERALKRLDIDAAGLRRAAGVRVNPDPAALLGAVALVELVVEVVSDCAVVEGDEDLGAALLDEDDIAHIQEVSGTRDPEPTDLGRAEITQVEQLRPRGRAEP